MKPYTRRPDTELKHARFNLKDNDDLVFWVIEVAGPLVRDGYPCSSRYYTACSLLGDS